MPIRSFELTPELDGFITSQVESGAFRDADGVVQAALALLEREERENEAEIQAVDEGEASGLAEGDVFGRIKEARRLRRQQPVSVG